MLFYKGSPKAVFIGIQEKLCTTTVHLFVQSLPFCELTSAEIMFLRDNDETVCVSFV